MDVVKGAMAVAEARGKLAVEAAGPQNQEKILHPHLFWWGVAALGVVAAAVAAVAADAMVTVDLVVDWVET